PNTLAVSLGLINSKNNTHKPNHHGNMSKKKKDWKVEKERLQSLGLEERRKEYRGNYVPLEKIPTWKKSKQEKSKYKEEVSEVAAFHLSDKVSLYKGDITTLEVDAIVNAGILHEFL
uniref:Mono-ADP ribosylhydrolase 2 n=1 Tax=Lepisosteus oculatus TaxID=7918 RepID=W5NGC1_LEPOC